MPLQLSAIVRRFLIDPKSRQHLQTPFLVWQDASSVAAKEVPDRTVPGLTMARPRAGEPLVFEVAKQGQAMNGFASGVTIGRTANNDICIPDESISRFHAYLQPKPGRGVCTLTDAGSTNGTTVRGVKVLPNRPIELQPRTELCCGDVRLLFLSPEEFVKFVDALSR